jgi:F-box and WD-40 domain protein CDC4
MPGAYTVTRTRTVVLNVQPQPEKSHVAYPLPPEVRVDALAFSRNHIALALDDFSLRVYDRADGALLHVLQGHGRRIRALCAIESTLISGGDDRHIRVWNMITGRCTHLFADHNESVLCLRVVRPLRQGGVLDRCVVISGSQDNSLIVWNVPMPQDEEFLSPVDHDGFMTPVRVTMGLVLKVPDS